MKIGMLLPSVYMGNKYKNKIFAPKALFLDLANGLVDRGHEVYVYASSNTKTKANLIPGEERYIEKDFISPKFKGLERIERLKNAHLATRTEYEIDLTVKAYLHAEEKKLDIIHSYHSDAFMAHYINKLMSIKTVYTIHDPKPRKEHIEYWRFNEFKKDNYIFISKSQIRDYRGMVKSVGVIYHGVDANKFTFDNQGGSYLAFLGRYLKQKGVSEAIIAAKESGVLLKMIGDDAYRVLPYYQNNILPNLKKGSIEDESFLGEGDRVSFLRNARVLLFPIQWEEPFGMVMIEAMSCGTPVIAFNRGSVSEVVKDGVTGFIIDQDNANRPNKGKWIIKKNGVAGLVEAINKIKNMSTKDYQQMRLNCRKHIEENFSVQKMAERHETVYKKILGK